MFWLWRAETTSLGTSERASICTGFSQMRMLYWPTPKTVTPPTPSMRASSFCRLRRGEVIEEKRVVAVVLRVQRDDLENGGGFAFRDDALGLHRRRQLRDGGGDAVLHEDLRGIGIGADLEGNGEGIIAVVAGGRLHVDHALDAIDLELDGQRDLVDDRLARWRPDRRP